MKPHWSCVTRDSNRKRTVDRNSNSETVEVGATLADVRAIERYRSHTRLAASAKHSGRLRGWEWCEFRT
jgi:hypothetical protein